MIVSLGGVDLDVNVEETRRVYTNIRQGGSEECGCAYCRNYREQLPNPLPVEVMKFFGKCGIDARKDAEVYHMGDEKSGYYCYGGEYFFISYSAPMIDSGKLANGFQFTITEPSPLEPKEFRGVPGSRCFNFIYDEMPWVLNEQP